ncbi:MAG: DEAD/DEAH box helicase, partial [Acidimicrobiia bacterium]|nr:DEAD/DEAH box helicase [Acidimicrobiia bacterium]
MDLANLFSPATDAWFRSSFAEPTPAQSLGWPAIAEGAHTLIHAPTGSGKTLAAFLYTVDRLLNEPLPDRRRRCRVLYVSPMKALAHDVERNLRAPLTGIHHAAAREGLGPLQEVVAGIRTGDTPQDERRRMQRLPPDILITTPESLYLVLTSQAREILSSVRWVILDEVHAIAGTKRGTHLTVSLERLEKITSAPPQRIGLSATQRPLETIGRFLGGGNVVDGEWNPRPVGIVDVPSDNVLDVQLIVPVEDMAAPAPPDPLSTDHTDVGYRSIWPSVYPEVLELIQQHQSTIVFANSRRLAERICTELNNLAGEEVARAHHGSVSREQRVEIEELLKRGDIPAVVATSSLELGIDMGAVDLVIQVESPTSVASGLQRVGRAGHQVGAPSVAKIFPKYRGDLLEATVVADRMLAGAVEPTTIPKNPLDVLAQHIVAMVAMDDWMVDDLYELVRRAAPYGDLAPGPFEAVLDMVSGRYPSELFGELRPRIVWDRVEHRLTARAGAHRLAVTNPGTIPDRGLYTVNLPEGARVGELDEEMVYESRPGDVFILGTSTWRITDITQDRVEVVPAPGETAGRMPFWRGDQPGRPLETGRAVGRFIREAAALPPETAETLLAEQYHLDPLAARNLVAYLAEERDAIGVLPSDQVIVIERFRDEIGDWRIVILSPLGARVHAPWAIALNKRFREQYGRSVDVIWGDDGIAFRFVDADDIPGVEELMIDPDDLEPLLMEELADTAMFAAHFREAAARALLLPRRRPDGRTPLWLQRRRAADLMEVAKDFGSFPIVLEVYREILQDRFDLPALTEVLRDVRSRKIRIVEIETTAASPFAASLLFEFVASYLYEGDTPLAERRAAALTLDRDLLRELLGEGELRELLSIDVIESVEMELQRLIDERKVRGVDGVHDLLRTVGPLSTSGVADRLRDGDAAALLAELEATRRIIRLRLGGSEVWAAVEDAGRLRDALGAQPPQGVPQVFLETVDDPLGDIVGRYARTHGPFTAAQVATELGLPIGVVGTALGALVAANRITRGAFRPGTEGQEWIDNEVLRRLKRRSLAALRKEIEAVDQSTLARFLPAWQGIGRTTRRDVGALTEVLRQLQGAAIPSSILERDVLASRMDYDPELIDHLMVSGEIVWIGQGPIGPRDGRLALYLRDHLPLLYRPNPTIETPQGPTHQAIRAHLSSRGASFFRDLYAAAGGGDPDEALNAVWDLVWAGEVTNDSLAPVRALRMARARRGGGGRGRRPTVPSSMPPSSVGRWSLVAALVPEPATDAVWAAAWTDQLLERHGIVTRSAALADGVQGG